jgi:hypothetical protein
MTPSVRARSTARKRVHREDLRLRQQVAERHHAAALGHPVPVGGPAGARTAGADQGHPPVALSGVQGTHRDTILGILYTRDLLGVDLAGWSATRRAFRKLLRQPNFFPESKPAVELFHTFRQRKLSFALIVDEYGGVTGLVTMEDLLECVFGEIASPSDSEVVPRHLVSELLRWPPPDRHQHVARRLQPGIRGENRE